MHEKKSFMAAVAFMAFLVHLSSTEAFAGLHGVMVVPKSLIIPPHPRTPYQSPRRCTAIISMADARELRARQQGKAFVEGILQDYDNIPNSGGMRVLRGGFNLETWTHLDIIVRNITEPFWQDCIDKVCTPGMCYRLCAVGTSGVGMTTCTAILIRTLLLQQKTVVYLVRSLQEKTFYYEFIPRVPKPQDGPFCSDHVTVNVYPQSLCLKMPFKVSAWILPFM